MLSNSTYYIGVDGGGTKTHAVLTNNGKIIAQEYMGPANIRTDLEEAYSSISTIIDKLIKDYNLSPEVVKIGVGVAGYSVVEKKNQLKACLENKYPNIKLSSDCHIACMAAHNACDGAIVICGTGVVGYSIYHEQTKQIGGWGFPHGDLGGGAWLGLEISRELCRAIDGAIPWNNTLINIYNNFFNEDSSKCKMWLINAKPADYSAITKFVITKQLDDFSNQLILRAIEYILEIIQVFKEANPSLPIKVVGGLAKLYLNKINQTHPDIRLSDVAPALGATYIAE